MSRNEHNPKKKIVRDNIDIMTKTFCSLLTTMKSQNQLEGDFKLKRGHIDSYSMQVDCMNIVSAAKKLLDFTEVLKTESIISCKKLHTDIENEAKRVTCLIDEKRRILLNIKSKVLHSLEYMEGIYNNSPFR